MNMIYFRRSLKSYRLIQIQFSPLKSAPTANSRRKVNTMNELILSAANAPTKFNFKNAKLNEISAKIAVEAANMNSVYNAAKEGAESVNKALAPLFGELLTTKCFKDDGFKSVAEYAEQTFGMSKSMAYMLARVGEQFYNTDNDYTRKARETLSTSKLNELTGTDRVAIAKAIEAGELSSDTSLALCRDFAASHKKPGKEKVVPTFNLFAMSGARKDVVAENVTKDELQSLAANYSGLPFYTSIKLDGDKPSAAQHFIMFSATGVCAMFEYRPYVSKSATTKGKGKDVSSLKDMLAAMSPAERLELLKALDGGEGEEA